MVGPRRCRRAYRVGTPAVGRGKAAIAYFRFPPPFRDEHLKVFPLT
jgi:hypothetical protein